LGIALPSRAANQIDAEPRIRAAGIDPQSRPQDLDISQFAALTRAFGNTSGPEVFRETDE